MTIKPLSDGVVHRQQSALCGPVARIDTVSNGFVSRQCRETILRMKKDYCFRHRSYMYIVTL